MSMSDLALSAIGLTGAIGVGWLTWRMPTWAVALVVFSVPLQAFARIGSDQAGITWTQGWLWTSLAMAALLLAARVISIRVDLMTVLLATVVVCYIVSRHASVDGQTWRNEVYRWSVTLAFFVCARALLRGCGSATPMLVVTAIGAIWTGITAGVQVAGDVGPSSFERSGRPRAYASFGEPNTYGAFAGGCLVVLAAYLLYGRRVEGRWGSQLMVAGCAFAVVGLGLSQSRGALAATGVISGVMVVVKLSGLNRVPPVVRVAAAVATVVLALFGVTRVADGIGGGRHHVEVTSASWANQERLAHWGAATALVAESDGLGVGAGQFDTRYRAATPAWRFRISQGHAHNAYLQVAAEAGLIALGAYVAMIATVIFGLGRRIQLFGVTVAPVGALALTGAFALHNLVDYLHVLNLPIILVAWWAMAFGQSEGSTAST